MGGQATTYNSTKAAAKVSKRRSSRRRDSPTTTRRLRSRSRFFWYTTPDGTSCMVKSNDKVPAQVNTYVFESSALRHEPYPTTFPDKAIWPPRRVDDVLCAIGLQHSDCAGDSCYNGNICEDLDCTHTLSAWSVATADWENYFELRMTEHRGIGVYTRRAFRRGAILGWYAGELKSQSSFPISDYLMDVMIGDTGSDTSDEERPAIYVDSGDKGNWTRFINHSCAPDCIFRIMRVGDTRIMAVEAIRDIPKGKELSVDYGEDYYGLRSRKRCACGVPECVSRKRARMERAMMRKQVAEEKRKVEEKRRKAEKKKRTAEGKNNSRKVVKKS